MTVPQILKNIVRQTPFLEESLSLGIINLSSLARNLQPEVEKQHKSKVEVGAITMALKRIEVKLKRDAQLQISPFLISNLTTKTNLVEFTFHNSPTFKEKQRQILGVADKGKGAFLTFTHGIYETTLICSKSLEGDVEDIFSEETMSLKIPDLSAITLIIPQEAVKQPGFYYQILKKLAWEGINVIEVISSMTELTIILENSSIDKAFLVLKK